jgi:ABC-type sugar transport system ATPase subunit/ribose/xylose/arabinose/galactoside ABC-type transport system permease subunit
LEEILHVNDLVKTFPGVRALDRVGFSCLKGEVHALVGENGAGKSTLMKILAGAMRPDSGEVVIKGNKVERFAPEEAQRLGVGTIYQELSLLPHLTVAENIFLGHEPKDRWGLVDFPEMEAGASALLEQLDGVRDPRLRVRRLSLAQRQMVEIAKALSFNPDILIMDEPSPSLAEHELAQLFAVIRSLRARGVTVIYISHRLEEVFEVADRVSVLKDGQIMATMEVADTNRAELIKLMVGREVAALTGEPAQIGDEVLEVKGLTRAGALDDINLELHRGEILGIAGLVGSGRTELARAICGADRFDSGFILLHGTPIRSSSPATSIQAGAALMPEDRKAEGLALNLTVRENIALPSLRRRQWLGFVQSGAEEAVVRRSVAELAIQTPSIDQQVGYLSGGNQQKVVLAKWLNAGPDVIIFDEPTRGIDVGAKAEIYELLRQLARSGKAIMMISSELPEILHLSDRILVLSGGRIAGELNPQEATEEKILSLAFREDPRAAGGTRPVDESAKPRPPRLVRWLAALATRWRDLEWGEAIVFAILAVIVLAGSLGSDTFLTGGNLSNLLRQVVVASFLAIGQALVILSGGIDLSVSAVVTLTMLFGVGTMGGDDSLVIPGILLCLALGLLVGLVNSFIVLGLRVPAIIATLGTMSIGRGLALAYTRVPIGPVPASFRGFAHGTLGPLPFSTPILLLIIALAAVLLYRTAYGRHLVAVGGNDEIARLSGIKTERVRALAYILSGLLAALSGLYLSSRMTWGDPTVGPGLELDSITAVLLGGTVLGGGRGGLVGTLGGVLVFVALSNVLNLLGLQFWYKEIIQGIIIILAISLYIRK